ncbi:hypothetical protein [Streptomyces sp. NPDC001436]
MGRIRPGRVRTQRNNRRQPLRLSTLAAHDFNVRVGEQKSVVCPDCRTWRRIMGETDLKIREHCVSDRLAPGEEHTLCPGSNQLVVVDIDVRRWQVRQDRLLRDAMPAENRRGTRGLRKPSSPPAPSPVHKIGASRA